MAGFDKEKITTILDDINDQANSLIDYFIANDENYDECTEIKNDVQELRKLLE